MKSIGMVMGVGITQYDDKRVAYKSRAMVDADGSNGISRHPLSGAPLFAYRPNDSGLDSLSGSAGYPNHSWWRDILVNTDDDPTTPEYLKEQGRGHIIQFNGGYYSKTAWYDALAWNDPARYLDAVSVPYIVVPPQVRHNARGIVLGCMARVTYLGLTIDCVTGDISGADSIGELSIAAADALGIDSNARTGGIDAFDILYELWPDIPAIVRGKSYRLIREER